MPQCSASQSDLQYIADDMSKIKQTETPILLHSQVQIWDVLLPEQAKEDMDWLYLLSSRNSVLSRDTNLVLDSATQSWTGHKSGTIEHSQDQPIKCFDSLN